MHGKYWKGINVNKLLLEDYKMGVGRGRIGVGDSRERDNMEVFFSFWY